MSDSNTVEAKAEQQPQLDFMTSAPQAEQTKNNAPETYAPVPPVPAAGDGLQEIMTHIAEAYIDGKLKPFAAQVVGDPNAVETKAEQQPQMMEKPLQQLTEPKEVIGEDKLIPMPKE